MVKIYQFKITFIYLSNFNSFIYIIFKELLKEVYFNIDWLYLKIKVFDLKQLLNDFDLYKKDNETNIICECLKMAEQGWYICKHKLKKLMLKFLIISVI